ncbi:carcinoembryonic antigen-related cell adhesion molecule 5-like [Latimeria chalumnae]|uniref:carcinoembryonic antigen-related cell adhesion molecule 5-like n=1 Tax=Latimeria chalumnae TaxID=7897 RepID=UPI00313EB231
MTFNVQGTPDTILWYKDQKPLLISTETRSISDENRIRLSSDNKTLTISSVSRTDSGIYQGEASNPVSTSRSEEMKIDISYGPDTPIITLDSNPIFLGSRVTLNCTAASSPAPNYEWNFNDNKKSTGQFLTIPVVSVSDGTPDTILWYKDQKPLLISAETRSVRAENRIRLSSDNKTLTISSVSRTDSGIYQGEASNPVSTSRSEEMKIDISYGPDTPIITLESNPVLVGSKVTLNCTAASSPAPNYEWNFNDKKKSTGQLLTIPVVSISDAGTYTCLAFNTKTNLRSRKHLELKVTDAAKQESNVVIVGQLPAYDNVAHFHHPQKNAMNQQPVEQHIYEVASLLYDSLKSYKCEL